MWDAGCFCQVLVDSSFVGLFSPSFSVLFFPAPLLLPTVLVQVPQSRPQMRLCVRARQEPGREWWVQDRVGKECRPGLPEGGHLLTPPALTVLWALPPCSQGSSRALRTSCQKEPQGWLGSKSMPRPGCTRNGGKDWGEEGTGIFCCQLYCRNASGVALLSQSE